MKHTVVALYDNVETARDVVQDLRDQAGVPQSDVSLVAHDPEGRMGTSVTTGTTDTGDSGAATGAGIGAAVGGLGGLLVGLGALAIPGIGPVLAAGPLATALAGLVGAGVGAVAGGVTGGLIGALVDMGIPEEQAQYYSEGVRRGGTLVMATVNDTNLDRARDIMYRHNPVDVETRAAHWRQAGWTGYDAGAQPYTSAQVTEERQRYGYGTNTAAGMRSAGMGGTGAMDDYSRGWREHYQNTYGMSGRRYEDYEPAYRYGSSLRDDARYRGWDWDRLEPEARRDWETRYPNSPWTEVRLAVRRAWEDVKQAVRD
jgi:hypothetical protein